MTNPKKGFNKECDSLREWRDDLKKEPKLRQISSE